MVVNEEVDQRRVAANRRPVQQTRVARVNSERIKPVVGHQGFDHRRLARQTGLDKDVHAHATLLGRVHAVLLNEVVHHTDMPSRRRKIDRSPPCDCRMLVVNCVVSIGCSLPTLD